MTSDDLDTRQVKYGVIEEAELESSIHFAFNNHPEFQARKTLRYLQRLTLHRKCSENCSYEA